MDDNDFEPRLGRMAAKGREPRYLNQVMRAARRAGNRASPGVRRFDGSRIGRGAGLARVLRSGDRHARFRARRVIVKTRLAMLAGKGRAAAAAHLRYIQRDGVTREGAPGELYSAEQDKVDGKAFLERGEGDRHQFRFIVSAEDAGQIEDLKPFTRALMRQMEEDLGTRLDWVAVDHFNTGHPHTHILLRGKDDRGENLVIAREYISHGLREQASRIMTLDLGPRTDLEIEERLRGDVMAERLTAIDHGLIRDMDGERVVSASEADSLRQALRAGRLKKLASLGLAEPLEGGRWRLDGDLAGTLRRMGERGDIIRTIQRELSARNLERATADRVIFDPAAEDARPVTGRVVMRGLADEHLDRHYLIVDGIDGRTHYAEIGKGEFFEPIPAGAIVRVSPRSGGVRDADRTVAWVAAANGGRYTIDAHLRHDPAASHDFAETHVRRLEAMRRVMRSVEREPDGTWVIASDHLDKAAAFEARQLRDRPVTVETLSPVPLERLAGADASTWLDRELVSGAPVPVRDAGFGREVRAAQAVRRQWLIEEGLAEERGGETVYRPGMLASLQRRELLRLAGQLSEELGMPFLEARAGERLEGLCRQPVEAIGGRLALIEKSREFTLVPWRPVLERQLGKKVSGLVREGGISWTIGRERGGPSIS
ncbi:relaxase/mobilization nuclease RlxS [Novosphingobium malaysiense]|uniref:Conjugal transfer protein TraI n=1 Tax=Novosphingobium malaysiense TaxID=1348853 RepID=A0A0B1ZEZ1_9SPHN|nr:relaxase/mobilization nuclease RlxS [Novosphingobium malaysiense]KHK89060.1 conjugal transfer protein TraI [Novosphingobium malaysiense]